MYGNTFGYDMNVKGLWKIVIIYLWNPLWNNIINTGKIVK